jgi:hypothetical protein
MIDNIDIILEQIKNDYWYDFDGKQNIDEYLNRFIKINDDLFGSLPNPIVIPNINISKWNTNIYRARRFSDIKNLNLRSEFSYPPVSFCKKSLRANVAFNPVFYASDHILTSLREIIDINNFVPEKYCLSVWKIRENVRFNVSPFIFGSLDQSCRYNELSESIINRIPNKLKDDVSKDVYINSLINYSKLFIHPNSYVVSSFIGHLYLYAKYEINTDILIYPSVQVDRKAVNFAINPNFADENLILERVYNVSVNKYNLLTHEMELVFHDYATISNNMLKWINVEENDELFVNLLKSDFDSSVLIETLKFNKVNKNGA